MLRPGTTIGSYLIEEEIGQGGMATVFRAQHQQLHTLHALKVLTVSNERLKERLLREGRTQAALRHPHIVSVTDAVEKDGTVALIMDWVDGPSLAQLLAQNPPTISQVDILARQIIHGMAAAHEYGVIHRDLKPDNILLELGKGSLIAKVADFGLVKFIENDGQPFTHTGANMGTPAYMAPEQFQDAKNVDERADIFSLGAVLYEMVCGRRAFAGENLIDIFEAIRNHNYVPTETLVPNLPKRMKDAIDGALEPDVSLRLANCTELLEIWTDCDETAPSWDRSFLRDTRKLQNNTAQSSSTYVFGATSVSGSRRWLWWGFPVFITLVIGVLLGSWQLFPQPTPLVPHVTQFTTQPGVELFPAMDRQGERLAFVGQSAGEWDIYVRKISEITSVNLTDSIDGDVWWPAFSPDGTQIAFGAPEGIYIMSSQGGIARLVTNRGHTPAWSPDGKKLAVTHCPLVNPFAIQGTLGLSIVDIESGSIEDIWEDRAFQPAWSPEGRQIAFWTVEREIWLIDADGSNGRMLINSGEADWNPLWARAGEMLFLSERNGSVNLWTAEISSDGELSSSRPITQGGSTTSWSFTASSSGNRLIYSQVNQSANLYRIPLNGDPPKSLTKGSHLFTSPRVSPDGAQVAFSSRGRTEQIWVANIDGTNMTMVTHHPSRHRSPHWSPDGKRLLYISNRDNEWALWMVRLGIEGEQRAKLEGGPTFPVKWASSGMLSGVDNNARLYFWEVDAVEATFEPPEGIRLESMFLTDLSTDLRTGIGHHAQLGLMTKDLDTHAERLLEHPGQNPEFLSDDQRFIYQLDGT
ncbi:MAG: serine/threonine-protein kinase, partial [Proteobacteria bacterium]|nr:serine/threonine-protein kinase [Pseudomonadota bacterium]